MAKRKTSRGASHAQPGITPARSPTRGPRRIPNSAKDAPIDTDAKTAGSEAVAKQFAYNAAKPSEFTADAIESPHYEVHDLRVSGSTLSEFNESPKTGSKPATGMNLSAGTLDRVRVDSGGRALTTNQGVPVADNQNSLKASLRGPALLQDFILREKITHFDHERIPERIVHARGSAAHGYFECYKPLRGLTSASLFAEAGKRTPVFVRFSTVAGERGSTDTARDVRGFAVKFYTDEGNWDLVGNNIPVFFIQDAMKFPDLIHAVKPEPNNAMPQAASAHDTFWDFVSLMPESTHMLLWVMSDRAIPRSYRMMQGFGVHTFRFVNAKGESRFVKFHWEPKAGTHSLVWDEAVKISGVDPDFHRRDLWDAIEAGTYPEWELGIQVFTEEQADKFSFDVLDATKLIPEELVPVQTIGRMVLDRNPDNFFAETEQVAFCTAHIVPGLDFSNDPLLAGRIHSYVDTQISRLGGANFHEIPINAPLAQVHNNQRDGMHRQAIPRGRVAYEPNSLGGGCPFQAGPAGFRSFPQALEGDQVRGKPQKFAEHYLQATLFWQSQSPSEQQHIIHAFRFELSKVQVPAVRRRVVAQLRNVAEELAQGVAKGLGLTDLPDAQPRILKKVPKAEVTRSSFLSLLARPGDEGIRTRHVAIVMSDGADTELAEQVHDGLTGQGAVPKFIGVHMGMIRGRKVTVQVDGSLEIMPSVLWDGVVVLDSQTASLGTNGKAVEFLKDQYRHSKTILLFGNAKALLAELGLKQPNKNGQVDGDAGLLTFDESSAPSALATFTSALLQHRHFGRETDPPRV